MDLNELLTIAQRLREYVGNPHHVDPMSDAFKVLIDEASKALSDAANSHWVKSAWKHTMHYEEGCGSHSVFTESPKHPFGRPNVDYDKTFRVTSEPLYLAKSPQR